MCIFVPTPMSIKKKNLDDTFFSGKPETLQLKFLMFLELIQFISLATSLYFKSNLKDQLQLEGLKYSKLIHICSKDPH